MMDSHLKAITLPKGTGTGGIAFAAVPTPDGTVWVTDKRNAPTANAGQVFAIAGDGSKYETYPLPPGPAGRGLPHPAYIALQLSGTTVDAVWVSDLQTGIVYRLKPGTKDAKQVVPVDLGPTAKLRGIAWDSTRKKIWVADEGGHQLLAIDPSTNAPDTKLTKSLPGSIVALLAVSPNGVWFTEYGSGKLGVLDDKNNLRELDFGEVADDRGIKVPISYPYGLAVDGDRVWVTTTGTGELWTVDGAKTPATATLRKVASLGSSSVPVEVTVDTAGYLWVTLSGTQRVVELTEAGLRVKEYEIDADPSLAAIAFASGRDEIWISDENDANQRIIQLVPLDKIPDDDADLVITAVDDHGSAKPGDTFPSWKVIVEQKGTAVEWLVTLTIDRPEVAFFTDADPDGSLTVQTNNPTGEYPVATLQAKAGAKIGEEFHVIAKARGKTTLPTIYTGRIGEAIKGIKAVNDDEDKTQVRLTFPKKLEVEVDGPGGTYVVFQITDGDATFAENGQKTYRVQTDTDGHISVVLVAGDTPGQVTVTAHAADDTSTSATFKKRTVYPIPDNIDKDPTDADGTRMHIRVKNTSDLYTVTVTGTHNSDKYPVPAMVEISIVEVSGGATGVVFVEDATGNKKATPLRIKADDDGKVAIGEKQKWYIRSDLKPGRVDVVFEVIDDKTPEPVILKLHPTVTMN